MFKNINIKIFNEKIFFDSLNVFVPENFGAIVTFLGIVKNKNNNKYVDFIFYDVFDELMISCIEKKCLYFLKRDNSILFNVFQRKGKVLVGDINLVVHISSENRKKSFLYCKLLLEFIKKDVPIWKKEYYLDGSFLWINSVT